MLQQAAPEVEPAEAAYEVLERLGAAPPGPRFAVIGGLRTTFTAAAVDEARGAASVERAQASRGYAIAIDDADTVEVDDAISVEHAADGAAIVRIHIALVADFVAKGGAMDEEAAARGTTVYLPEATVRMLPDAISCDAASLLADAERPVLTTEVRLAPDGSIDETRILPERIRIARRLDYERADAMLAGSCDEDPAARALRELAVIAGELREQRRRRGAVLVSRREAKVKVRGDEIEVTVLDAGSPSRTLVAELMVLGNFAAACFAARRNVPILYRVQPDAAGELAAQRPRLSLHPDSHAGMGLECYAQLSSPIRRYADLVMQRQVLAALSEPGGVAYSADELLAVLAQAEAAETLGRELERRAKRYWILRLLERFAPEGPLRALATRDGAGAELADYAIRGTLFGAPNLAEGALVLVRLSRVDPLRGRLALDYLGPGDQSDRDASPARRS
jgi:exoribonuclease-2